MLIPLLAATLATAAAPPPVCTPATIQKHLLDTGKLTQESIGFGEVVDLVRCGDVTADGHKDALFTVASGGTAGDTRFGVLEGDATGEAVRLVLWRDGYKLGIARHNRRSFDVIQPHYRRDDPNCCPSSFRVRRYTWKRGHFKAAHHTKKLKKPPRRFYRA